MSAITVSSRDWPGQALRIATCAEGTKPLRASVFIPCFWLILYLQLPNSYEGKKIRTLATSMRAACVSVTSYCEFAA
jgi:hypothetical protein